MTSRFTNFSLNKFILHIHSRFVYPKNQHDSLSLSLGVSSSDPLRETKLSLMSKLGMAGFTHFSLFQGDSPISAELLAFIRIFNMNQGECDYDLGYFFCFRDNFEDNRNPQWQSRPIAMRIRTNEDTTKGHCHTILFRHHQPIAVHCWT